MKTINVPAPVLLTDPDSGATGESISFLRFVRHALLTDNRFNKGFESLKLALEIDGALRAAPIGDVDLSAEAWAMLRDVATTPSAGCYMGFQSLAMFQLVGFIEAIIQASEAPRKKRLAAVAEEAPAKAAE